MNSDTKGFSQAQIKEVDLLSSLRRIIEDLRNILELKDRVEATLSELETKGYKREEIAIGFIDESSLQSTANTVRVWSFDDAKPHSIKKHHENES